jgi:dolichol-phosphate mannosyltransferase
MGSEANPMQSPVDLSFILPMYNEEESIEAALDRVSKCLQERCREYEIIVIDDCSRDRTGEVAKACASKDPKIRVLTNERNLNYGLSLRRGIAEAKFEWLVHNGADLPLAPEDMGPFFDAMDDADVIVACRKNRDAHSNWRKVTSLVNRALLGLLFAPRSSDLNFTQFYRRSVATRFQLVSDSPVAVTPELILRSEKTGHRVIEIEIPFQRREAGKAHFGKPKDILWTLRDLARLRIVTWFRGWG